MKFIDRLIRTLLIIMVIISIFLSIQTWLDIGSYPLLNKEVTSKNNTQTELQKRKRQTLFLPTNLYLRDNQTIKIASQETNLKQVVKEIAQVNYSVSLQTTKKTRDDLLQQQNAANSLDLEYLSPMNLNDFLSLYKLNIQGTKPQNFMFNHLVINAASGELTFFNTDNNKLCLLSADKEFLAMYKDLLTKTTNNIQLNKDDKEFSYNVKDDLELPKYRYAITTPSYTVFTKAFFETTGELTSKDNLDNLVFADSDDNTLQLNSSDGTIDFSHKLAKNAPRSEINKLAVNKIQKLGNEAGDLRYFMTLDKTSIYKNYIEGLPIFGNYYHGEVQTIQENNRLKILLNQEIAQVPLPTDEKVQLLSTTHVDDKLREKELDLSKITKRQIGYHWKTLDKNTVLFEPTWYLLYENTWYSLDDLLTLDKGE